MKKHLLFAIMLVVAFGSMNLHATITISSSDVATEFSSTSWTTSAVNSWQTLKGASYLQANLTDALKMMVRPGYTFAGWENDNIITWQGVHEPKYEGTYAMDESKHIPHEMDFSKRDPIHVYGHRTDNGHNYDITITFWAYMDDWKKMYEGVSQNGDAVGMRLVSCRIGTNKAGWAIGDPTTYSSSIGVSARRVGCVLFYSSTAGLPLFISKTWDQLNGSGKKFHPGDKANWHMFTLGIHSDFSTFWLDGGKEDEGKYTINTRITEATASVGTYYGTLGSNSGHMVIGGAPVSGTDFKKFANKFEGKIRGFNVIHGNRLSRTGTEEERFNVDAIIKGWYDNPNTPYAIANNDLSLAADECEWIPNPTTGTGLYPREEGFTTQTFSNGSNDKQEKSGVGDVITEPKQKDKLLLYWRSNKGDGMDYISKFQDFVPSVFHRSKKMIDGRSDAVNFDGSSTHYEIEKSKQWSDCFTVNVWAAMTDWAEYNSKTLRLFDCLEWENPIGGNGGFNIESENGYISFAGYDVGRATFNNAIANSNKTNTSQQKTWASLNSSEKTEQINGKTYYWHMFTYTFDGNFVRGYVDGQLVATSDVYVGSMGYNSNAANKIVVGAQRLIKNGTTYTGHFKGYMRDFSLMHTALAPSQVKALCNNPTKQYYFFPPQDATLIAECQDLPLLAATPKQATQHAIIGNGPTSQTVKITGNGLVVPTVGVKGDGWSIDQESLKTLTVDGGNVTVTYTPTSIGTQNSATITVKEDNYSTTRTATITGQPHEFEVLYWQDNGFVGKIDEALYEATKSGIKVNNQSVTITEKDPTKGTYFFEIANAADILDSQELTFTASDWSLSTPVKVKYINSDGSTDASHANHDIIIATDKTLTHSTEAALGDLYVQSGATFVHDASLTANSLVLYSEGDNAPNVHIPNGTTTFNINAGSNGATMYFVKRIPNDRFYFFSLPYNCNVSEIKFANGTSWVCTDPNTLPTGKAWKDAIYIKYYDGAQRGTTGTLGNWKYVTSNTLQAGVGYVVAIDSDVPANETRDIVFPMRLTTTANTIAELHTLDNKPKSTLVTAHGINSGLKPNHIGWNLVGNPYLANYKHQSNTDEDFSSLKTGALLLGDVDESDADNKGIYLTIPYKDESYWQVLSSKRELKPFSAFFVQASQTGSITFVPASRLHSSIAARQAPAVTEKPIYAGVTLAKDDLTDETSLVIGKNFTQDYEIGSDLEKMYGEGERPQVYVWDENYQYAFKSLPQSVAAGENKLGVYLPSDGEYTFAINDSYDLSPIRSLYLTDNEAGVTVDLTQESYMFTGSKGEDKQRFSIGVLFNTDLTTNLTNMGTETAWTIWQSGALQIQVQGLVAGNEIRVFNATGQLITQATATTNTQTLYVPVSGTYCVQTINAAGIQAKKIVVR